MNRVERIGELVKNYRERSGLTQWQLHKLSGVGYSTIGRIEQASEDAKEPTGRTMQMLARVFQKVYDKKEIAFVDGQIIVPMRIPGIITGNKVMPQAASAQKKSRAAMERKKKRE